MNKIKYLLLPYAFLIVVFPAVIAHLAIPWKLDVPLCENIMDGIMVITAVVGLVLILIRNKSRFRGWLPLAGLLVLILLPQIYLWNSQNRGFTELRTIYRYALLYITLFIIPLETHLPRKSICVLIGCLCVFGVISCMYALVQYPDLTKLFGKGEGMESWFGQKNRFGAYNALLILLCLLAVQLSGRKYWLIPATFFFIFLIMSKSRGAIVLTGISILCGAVSYRKHIGTKTLLMILLDAVIVVAVLYLLPPTRSVILSVIAPERGVGREVMWRTAWEYYLESNPLLGHGLGTQIERVMIERANLNYSTHNMYLYVLIMGGISMILFYALSIWILLQRAKYRHHYLIPLLIGWAVYGFFELAGTPFDYWHLSNMFTVCLFFIPSALSHGHHSRRARVIPVSSNNQ